MRRAGIRPSAAEERRRVDQQAAQYRIRLARPDELLRLREIDLRAGTMFSGLGLIEEALDGSFPSEDLITPIWLRRSGSHVIWRTCPSGW